MTTLHLGVTEIPYAGRPGKGKTVTTTQDVAEILEGKYHIFEHFYEIHHNEISSLIEFAVAGATETLMMGGRASLDAALGAAASRIEDMFRKMLDEKELDKLGYPGIPTGAALKGVSHRFGHPYARRGPRPSFVDSGLYQSSFKAWFE